MNKKTENVVKTSSWVATDGLGRKVSTNENAGNERKDRYVGVFFSPWHGSFAEHQRAYNNQQILDKYPDIDKNDPHDGRWGERGYHFWNEPIYGYYSGKDRWVIRRQAEMLAAAGVDAIVCDNTNGKFTWCDTMLEVVKVFNEARADGVNAPKIIFHLPFGGMESTSYQLKELYDKLYSVEEYAQNWFMWEGKPLIIAISDALEKDDPLRDYFTFRYGQPDYLSKQTCDEQWGWLSMYPQTVYRKKMDSDDKVEQMTAGVAQNHDYVNKKLTAMNGENVTGRSYTKKNGYTSEENAILYGKNFAEQFDYVLEKDPSFVLVTCYNEWVASRSDVPWCGVENAFADQFCDEYSRDVEPTKGALKDHYYYQMVDYIRKFKGAEKQEEASGPKTVDINGDISEWDDVSPAYYSYKGNTFDRCYEGYIDPITDKRILYKDNSGRNDLCDFKVAYDDENVYFMARCADGITPYTDKNWMQLYIDTHKDEDGWESFNYVLNKNTPKNENRAILERFTGEGFESVTVSEVEYAVLGCVMTVKIPKKDLGITDKKFTLDFKWADNVDTKADVMNFYISGDTAPTGRFKYRFIVK